MSNELKKVKKQIATALDTAQQAAKESKSDYDAGRYDGLKQALELINRELGRDLGL